jgi:hypothetical protein
MPHKDPVTEEVAAEVRSRDIIQRWVNLMTWFKVDPEDLSESMSMFRSAQENHCVAQIVDPIDSGPCSGRLTLDHVHRVKGGMMGKRAPSDPEHLVTLCHFHHLESRAGHIWALAHKDMLRAYLEAIYGPLEQGRGD